MFTYAKSAAVVGLVLAITGLADDPAIIDPANDAKKVKVFDKSVPPIPKMNLGQPIIKVREKPADRIEVAAGVDKQSADEQVLKNAGLKTESADLLEFFSKRTLPEGDRAKIDAAIRKLGAGSYQMREDAMHELIGTGPMVLESLRQAMRDEDPEISGRAEKCLCRILENDVGKDIAAAACRLLAVRKPNDALETLFGYFPTAQIVGIGDEVRDLLVSLGSAKGNIPEVVKGLKDPSPLRRAAAAEILCKVKAGGHQEAVRKLLQDADVQVRLRVGRCLALAGDATAVPTLVELLTEVSYCQAWQVDDILFRLAEGKNPPMVSVGRDEATRKKSSSAWHAWWQKEGKNVDMAKLTETPPLLGNTLVVLLDVGEVSELGKDNERLWTVNNLRLPLDAQVLLGDRVLVTEHDAAVVTERSTKTGEILWKKEVTYPLVAQRLSNGNTFIASDSMLLEFDRENKEVVSIQMDVGERIMKAFKTPSNEICCLLASGDQFNQFGQSVARVVRLDSTGKELNTFNVPVGMRLFGGRIHMLPNGNVLVPHNGENKVVEYDPRGRPVWEVSIAQPIAASRMANGNTLITSMDRGRGAIEFNPAGAEVWSFRYGVDSRVTRAVRR